MGAEKKLTGVQRPVEGAVDPEAMFPITGSGRRSWDRQPGEPATLFMLFLRFLAQDSSARSLRKLLPGVEGVTEAQLVRICGAFDREHRAKRFDSYQPLDSNASSSGPLTLGT